MTSEKLFGRQVFKDHDSHPFQSSLSLSIRSTFNEKGTQMTMTLYRIHLHKFLLTSSQVEFSSMAGLQVLRSCLKELSLLLC